MCLKGGYKTQTVVQLSNLLAAYNSERISARALRIYFAALIIVAAREAAKRTREEFRSRKQVTPRYLFKELATLSDCPMSRVRGELRSLEAAGLLLFSEVDIAFNEMPIPGTEELLSSLSGNRSTVRPIPIPRPVLRYLAKSRKVALTKTCLAYIIRGLTISRTGEVKGRGTAKAVWIAQVMKLSLRAVRSSRAELIELGFIDQDEGSKQWKLNRDGAYFCINLGWQAPNLHAAVTPTCSSSAPRKHKNCTNSALPYEDMKTPYGSKNQKTQRADKAGFCGILVKIPNLKAICVDDLKRLSRLKVLYAEAVRKNWIAESEASLLRFVSAAVRATRVGRDPVRVFVTIVRNQLWHHITQEQEDRAVEVLKKEQRQQNPEVLPSSLVAKDLLHPIHSMLGIRQ